MNSIILSNSSVIWGIFSSKSLSNEARNDFFTQCITSLVKYGLKAKLSWREQIALLDSLNLCNNYFDMVRERDMEHSFI